MLTSRDIAALTATPERTIRWRLSRWHAEGGPVERVARPGGGWQYSVTLDAYARRVACDPAALRATLAEAA